MSEKGVFSPVRSELDFPSDEAAVRAFWKEHDVFHKSLKAETRATGPSKGTFVFYEGPPTANGMPHNGHVLTRAIKDVFPRFQTMRGYDVPRKAGWDTHGLPVEVEVEKDLGIHGKADIEAYGIKPFIKKCIESVFRYTEVWETNTEQLGYWVDLNRAYVTFHKSYVESVWWALSELHKKGLLYRGHKVVWWWPQGGTALSAGEVGQNYKTVDDPSAYVAFELADEPGTFLAVWTTTPWTLSSNGYAAVKGSYDYVKVEWTEGRKLVLAAGLREALQKKLKLDLEVVETIKGSDLVGRRYHPAFDTYSRDLWDAMAKLRAGGERALYWRIIDEDFVTLDSGTGIVHIAPAFGEDDNDAHRKQLAAYASIEDLPLICAVLPDGTFSSVMGDLAGTYVKDADRPLVKQLEERGALIHFEQYRHEYPFCWRADDDPLIQLARPAWYIRTTARIDEAIANNRQIKWLPEHIRDGRFGDFLNNNVDWALSRERFWGTPLNVWVCEAKGCDHEVAPPNIAAIEARNPDAFAGFHAARAEDPTLSEHLIVHKPWIDEVTLPCDRCGGTMRRVPEVIDCWFDSGCMPFAQWGFPHVEGSHAVFDQAFPADFISEAIDQTRGWFYSLLMVSTLVFDADTCASVGLTPRPHPHPYKSCVVLGHVSDREGKKESKSKGNYTPPDIILERVRMEFAPVSRADEALGKLAGKVGGAGSDTVHIAQEDYEGLDLAGKEATVHLHREGEAPETFTLVPLKGLPRRVVVMDEAARERLGLRFPAEALGLKPAAVPRLPSEERVFIDDPTRPAPGADAFRWFFYSASPPWTNTRHSLSNVRLAQKDFVIKLRNVYSFFCIYANIDGFSPAAGNPDASDTTPEALGASLGYRPSAERSLLDRWIASEVALAVREVADKLEGLLVYDAAQRLIELVDALSNWYVRRSRARFWAPTTPETKQDKLDASFTLYESLVTITKAIAPFVPFFAEEMYQNLVRRPWPESQPLSVHLSRYPEPDAAHVDTALAEEMAMVRELVSLGLQVRTEAKQRVRQPLRQADVVVASHDLRERLAVHEALILEELNVTKLRWLAPGEEGEEVSYQLKPNFRALGPRLGKRVQAVKKALAEADAGALRSELASSGVVRLDVEGEVLELTGEEVQVAVVASEGFAAAGGRAGVVVMHTELDQELLDEGLAREVLARIQARRKQLDLGYTDRIKVTLRGDARVREVVAVRHDHIEREALCDDVVLDETTIADELESGWEGAEVQGSRFAFLVES